VAVDSAVALHMAWSLAPWAGGGVTVGWLGFHIHPGLSQSLGAEHQQEGQGTRPCILRPGPCPASCCVLHPPGEPSESALRGHGAPALSGPQHFRFGPSVRAPWCCRGQPERLSRVLPSLLRLEQLTATAGPGTAGAGAPQASARRAFGTGLRPPSHAETLVPVVTSQQCLCCLPSMCVHAAPLRRCAGRWRIMRRQVTGYATAEAAACAHAALYLQALRPASADARYPPLRRLGSPYPLLECRDKGAGCQHPLALLLY